MAACRTRRRCRPEDRPSDHSDICRNRRCLLRAARLRRGRNCRCSAGRHGPRRIGHDLRPPGTAHEGLAAKRELDRGRGDRRPRPQRVERDPLRAKLLRHPEHDHRHAIFAQRVRQMLGKPVRPHRQWWGERQDMAVRRFPQEGHAGARHQEGAAQIDLLDEIEPFRLDLLAVGEVDRGSVVDAGIDRSEVLGGQSDGILDHLGVAHVEQDRQGLSACLLDFVGGGVDRARQFGMCLGGLRGDHHIGAVARRAQRDRKADSPAPAGDEKGFALERHANVSVQNWSSGMSRTRLDPSMTGCSQTATLGSSTSAK